MTDMTDRTVSKTLRAMTYDAVVPPVEPFAVDDVCGCGHETGAHHGPDGHGRCGETGCGCEGWHPCQVECSRCGAVFADGACPSCGLTVEDVAEAVAQVAETQRRKEWVR